jgi:putative acetyltransferase
MRIIEDDLSGIEVAELLSEHLASMHRHSPPGSVHALDLQGLRDANRQLPPRPRSLYST